MYMYIPQVKTNLVKSVFRAPVPVYCFAKKSALSAHAEEKKYHSGEQTYSSISICDEIKIILHYAQCHVSFQTLASVIPFIINTLLVKGNSTYDSSPKAITTLPADGTYRTLGTTASSSTNHMEASTISPTPEDRGAAVRATIFV